MRVKEESEKAGLKLNVQKTKIRASGPIASWQIEGEKRRSKDRFYFLGLQNHCGRWLPAMKLNILTPWKKSYNKPRQHIKKQRHHLAAKGLYSQSYVFPVVMYRCESWTIKKDECQRIDAFELCWRRLLRVPWTTRRSNKSILKEINPKYSFEGLMLKLQYFGYLMWQTDSMAKTLMLGKIEGRRTRAGRGWDGWMASPTQWTWVWANSRRQWKGSCLACCSPWGSQRVGHNLSILNKQVVNRLF